MKKALIAAAVAASFAGAAFAEPTVQVYGLIDTGLSYVHSKSDVAGIDSTNEFTMESGNEFGSRWGIRGSEKIGGTTLSFVLESGIQTDDGQSDTKQNNRLFGREASITATGKYGSLSAGRLPIFGSVLGANGLFRAIDPTFANYTVSMGSGYATASMWTRVDNAISYRTPTFGGLTGYAMYSFKNDQVAQSGKENGGQVDRYGSLALRYQNGAFEGVAVADIYLWGNSVNSVVNQRGVDDGYTVTLGGNYTFANQLKLIAFGQYFDNMVLNARARGGATAIKSAIYEVAGSEGYGVVNGYGLSIGANYPLFGGTIKCGLNFRDMDNESDVDFTRITGTVAYDYPLSKRTSLYAMVGYSQEKIKNAEGVKATPSSEQVVAGILHRF